MTDNTVGPTTKEVNNAQNLVGLMQQMQTIGDGVNKSFSDTFSATSQLVSAVSKLNEKLLEVNNSISQASQTALDLTGNLSDAVDMLDKKSNSLDGLINSLNKSNKTQEGWWKRQTKAFMSQKDLFSSLAALTKSIFSPVGKLFDKITNSKVWKVGEYLYNTLKKVYGMVGRVIKIVGFLAKSAFNAIKKVAELMIGIPLKISEIVSDIGGKFRKETVEEFLQMSEDIKEKINSTSSLGKSFSNSLTESQKKLINFYDLNNRFVRQFGYGAAGAKKMLTESQEIISGLGVNLNFFGAILGKNSETRYNLVRLQKALNMTAEDMENVGIIARSTGQGFMSLGVNIYSAIDRSAKKFALDGKTISGSVFKLRGDFIEFGHMTTEAIAESVAELTQMGVQAEDISGVFKKFDTFESAAQSAAMLSQTFGMNVDALRLIQAENPEEIFNELTSAMYNTGRSFSDLNRHERSLLAQHTGLSGKTLQMVMNYTEMGMKYEDAIAKAEAEDPVNKQTAALDKMTKSIKELNKILSFKSPFAAFADGFKKTLLQHEGVRESMESLNKSYESFYTEGLKINKSVLDKAAGPIKQIIGQLEDALGGEGLKTIMTNLVTNLSNFINSVFNGTIEDAKKSIREVFSFKTLDQGGSFGKKLMGIGGGIIGKVIKGMFIALEQLSIVLREGIEKFVKNVNENTGKGFLAETLAEFFGLDETARDSIITPALNEIYNLIVSLPKLIKPLQVPLFNFFGDIASFFIKTIKMELGPFMQTMIADMKDAMPGGKYLFNSDKNRAKAERYKLEAEKDRLVFMRKKGMISDKDFKEKVVNFNERQRQSNTRINESNSLLSQGVPLSAVYYGGKKAAGAGIRATGRLGMKGLEKVAPQTAGALKSMLPKATKSPGLMKFIKYLMTSQGRQAITNALIAKGGKAFAAKKMASILAKIPLALAPTGIGNAIGWSLLAYDIYSIWDLLSTMDLDSEDGTIDPSKLSSVNPSSPNGPKKVAMAKAMLPLSKSQNQGLTNNQAGQESQKVQELVEQTRKTNELLTAQISKPLNITMKVNDRVLGQAMIDGVMNPTNVGTTLNPQILRNGNFAETTPSP